MEVDMARYATKTTLLEAILEQRRLLEEKLAGLSAAEMVWPGAMDNWSVKDILAHVVDWEQRFIGWYEAARRGEAVHTPAPGMTWRDLPRLNQEGYERHRDRPLDDVLADFHASFRQILTLVQAIPAEEMFSTEYHRWTGQWRLAGYIAGNTCDHYRWARTQVRPRRIRQGMEAARGAPAGAPPLEALRTFVVRAKAATYVGGGAKSRPCRPGSHDLRFAEGEFAYLDSYLGRSDFIGEEVVYYQGRPTWAMNYYGRILEPARITAAEAGQIIQESLSHMYREGRFLGGFEHTTAGGDTYVDTSQGDLTAFTGKEWIVRAGVRVYELVYHGGLIRE
jgi:hypothetical protein